MKAKSNVILLLLVIVLSLGSVTGCTAMGPDEDTQAVIEQIDAIGTVTDDSGPAISQVEAAYRSLNDKQKEKVENYDTLAAARDDYDTLRAKAVEDAINGIGEVSLDNADLIDEVGEKYSGLTADQQKKVANAATLKDAQFKIDNLRKQFAVGDTVTTENWKVTLTNAYVSSTLESSASRTYWTPQDGAAFLVLEIDLEHLNSGSSTVDGDALADIQATYNSNTYSGWEYEYVASELWLYADRHTLDANMPLHLYVYTQIPSSSLDDDEPISVSLNIDGEDKVIQVR